LILEKYIFRYNISFLPCKTLKGFQLWHGSNTWFLITLLFRKQFVCGGLLQYSAHGVSGWYLSLSGLISQRSLNQICFHKLTRIHSWLLSITSSFFCYR